MQMRTSIQIKLMLVMVFTSTLILSGFGVYQYMRNGASLEEKLKERTGFIAERLGKSLASPLWDYSTERTAEFVAAEMQDSEISCVAVYEGEQNEAFVIMGRDDAGQAVMMETDLEAFVQEQRDMNRLEQSREVFNRDAAIGRVTVFVSDAGIREILGSQVWIIVIQTLLLDVLIVITLFFLVRSTLIRPLKKVLHFADVMGSGDLSTRLSLDNRDELGSLALALNGMAETLQDKAGLAGRIATGDLTRKVELTSDQDVLGKALQDMTASLNTMFCKISESANRVADSSSQVQASSQTLSQGATEQASSLEEISSSMQQIGAQARSNAENSQHADRLAAESRDGANRSNQDMAGMLEAMRAIQESSQSISRVIKVIDEIAFQTNLLALNAAVEAARAGRYGKGFAVVAEEVRNLAGRSARAARETTELITGSLEKVENGNAIAEQTASALGQVVGDIGKVAELVREISAASEEQARGVDQVNQGISQVEQVTHQNTAASEETAAAADELSGQASKLQEILSWFTVAAKATTVPDVCEQAVTPRPSATSPGNGQLTAYGQHGPVLSAGSGRMVEPGEVIALDDEEFGRY